MLGIKNRQDLESPKVVPLNSQGEEHLRSKDRARRNTRTRIIGATALTVVLGGSALIGNWLREDSASTNRSAERAVAASEADQARTLKENIQEEVEQDEVLQQRMHEFLGDLQASLISGEVVPQNRALIFDRGVRVRQTPEFDDLRQSGRVATVTDSVLAIENPIVFKDVIVVPNNSEAPYTLSDGSLNPDKFSFINAAIEGQTDDATGNPFTRDGVSRTDLGGPVSFTAEGIFMGDESTPSGRTPVSVVTSYPNMESAIEAFSAAP